MCRNHLLAILFKARVVSSASTFQLHLPFISRIRGISPPSASPAFPAGPARGDAPRALSPAPQPCVDHDWHEGGSVPCSPSQKTHEASLGKTSRVKHKPATCTVHGQTLVMSWPSGPSVHPQGCRRATTTCPSPAAVRVLVACSVFSLSGPKLLLYQLSVNTLSDGAGTAVVQGWAALDGFGEGEVCVQV